MRAMRLVAARRPLRGNGYTAIASGGTGQTGVVGSALATPFSVTVKDASGALASGVTVLWDSTSDGTFSTTSGTTNGSGVASSTLTLGSVAGPQTATATVVGVGVITFSATATAVAVASLLEPASTLDQSAATSATVAAPPSVLVTDQFGNPFAGKTITFAVASGGGSIVPADGIVVSDASGLATLTSWTLGGSVGVNTVTATGSSLTGSPITFTASAVSATPTQIAVTAGGSQTGIVAGQAATPITYRVRDVSNNNLEGVAVAFSTDIGTLSASSGTTDASGLASVTLTTDTTVGTATVTGSVLAGTISTSTTVVSTFGTATKVLITTQAASNGSSGTALPGQPIIRITDANGNTVTSGASSTLTVTITIVSGNGAPTGNTQAAVAGVATFTAFAITDVDGGVNIPRYTATGLAGTADGDGITLAPPVPDHPGFGGTVAGAVANVAMTAFTVEIRDSSNGVVPGATNAVTVALTTPGGATLSGTTQVNAVAGIATFSDLRVDTAGSYTFTATSTGLATPTAVSNSFTISAAGASHEPAALTTLIDTTWSGEAYDTVWTNPSVHGGLDVSTSASNMAIRRTSDQSWRDAAISQIPADPLGTDRILVDRFTTPTAQSKGKAVKNFPANVKSVYLRARGCLSSNWVGQNDGGPFKYLILYIDGLDKFILNLRGSAGSAVGAVNVTCTFGGTTNHVGHTPATSMGRNTWRDIEVVARNCSASGASDGSLQIWVDGLGRLQFTDVGWQTASGGNVFSAFQLPHYYGGTNTTSPNVTQYAMTNSLRVAYSTTRIALPSFTLGGA